MLSQFDIYIAVLILAAVVLANRSKWGPAAVMLGLAAGYKPLPLLLVPFLGEGWKQKIKYITVALATYLAMIIPYLGSVGFKHYALLASQSDKLVYAQILVSPGQYLPLFWVGLGVWWWWNYYKGKQLPTWSWWLSVLLWFYSVVHYHPQWFTWVGPLLVLAAVTRASLRLPMLVLMVGFVLVVFSFEPSLNLGLVGLNFSTSSFLTDANTSLVRATFAATSLATIALLLRPQKSEK